MNKNLFSFRFEIVRDALLNSLGMSDADLKAKLAYWIIRTAEDWQLLTMFLEGTVPGRWNENTSKERDRLYQDFEDMFTINETMTTNRHWDYERTKQFLTDNCCMTHKKFNEITEEQFEKYLEPKYTTQENDRINEVIDNMKQEGLVEVIEPEFIYGGELKDATPKKFTIKIKDLAYGLASFGFIIVIAALFYRSKK